MSNTSASYYNIHFFCWCSKLHCLIFMSVLLMVDRRQTTTSCSYQPSDEIKHRKKNLTKKKKCNRVNQSKRFVASKRAFTSFRSSMIHSDESNEMSCKDRCDEGMGFINLGLQLTILVLELALINFYFYCT